MNIVIGMECDDTEYNEQAIRELALFALDAEKAPRNIELSVALVTEEAIAVLNRDYSDKEGPTDVLSFCMDDPWLADEDTEVLIGDIVIAPAVARKQAPDYGNSFYDEMNLLLVHGVLHLLGYDHIVDEEAEAMEAREREILSGWKERQA